MEVTKKNSETMKNLNVTYSLNANESSKERIVEQNRYETYKK